MGRRKHKGEEESQLARGNLRWCRNDAGRAVYALACGAERGSAALLRVLWSRVRGPRSS